MHASSLQNRTYNYIFLIFITNAVGHANLNLTKIFVQKKLNYKRNAKIKKITFCTFEKINIRK